MFKNKALASIFTITLIMFSASVSAQVYVGGSLGSGESKDNCFYSKCDTYKIGYKIFGGYAFDKTFALEASSFQLGELTSSYQDIGFSGSTMRKRSGLSLVGLMNYDFTEKTSGFVKGGLASLEDNLKYEFSRSTGNFNHASVATNTMMMFGVGIKYKVDTNIYLRAEVEQYLRRRQYDSKINPRQVSIGVQYEF